jgi:hypothetical protein
MPISLRESLTRLTVSQLHELQSHLPIDKGGRKEQLVDRMADAMLGPQLPAIWSRLDETQQAAVAEAVHHPLGEYSQRRFRARYQHLPAFHTTPPKASYSRRGQPTLLCLFIHDALEQPSAFIPSDLRDRLKAFVPPPAPLNLASSETLAGDDELMIRLTEREALQEVVVMLRTLEQVRVQVSDKTALPGSATLRLLGEKLAGGDFYPPVEKQDEWDQEIGPIKAFAWPMLLQAGGLAVRNGTRLELGPAGVRALSLPPADVLRGLWKKWLKTTLFDEFSRIDTIKGQTSQGRVMTAVAPRRLAIEEALRECPVGRWIKLDDFSNFMLASDRLFAVTHDAWKLYICDRQYGALGYEGSGGWNILQERYLLALLFEYAATLGLIDIAYRDPAEAKEDFRDLWGADDLSFLSRYDGLQNFRLTPLGAYVLDLDARYQPLAILSNATLSVSPSLQVNVLQGALAAEETLLLESWAVPELAGSWRLDQEKALIAIEKGHEIATLKDFLERTSGQPLPEAATSFLDFCERNGKALKTIGNAVLIECRDPEIANEIAGRRETAALCLRAGPKTLAVRTQQLDKFRDKVRLLGFGMIS